MSSALSLLILVNTLQVSLTYAYYELDPIGFIEQLCENKDKPEMACNGKCQLKKVAESQTDNTNTPNSIVDFRELLLFNEVITEIQLYIPLHKPNLDIEYINHYSFSSLNDCFRPPQPYSHTS